MSEQHNIKFVHPWLNWSPFIAEAVTDRAFLNVSPTDGTDGEGFEWVISGIDWVRDTHIYSRDVNSEKMPYPTLEAARDACEQFYARVFAAAASAPDERQPGGEGAE